MKQAFLLLFSLGGLLFFSCQSPTSSDLISTEAVSVEGGMISGTSDSSGLVKIFKGIPFAAPPVGDLRWKAPQPVLPWEGVKACTDNPPAPMQNPPVPFFAWSEEFLIPKDPISEDCLYLNIWTAAEKSDEKRPVMVWIYGGGFSSGGNSVPLYDGTDLAKEGIVVVNLNYRVGMLGFFVHPDLSAESPDQTSGNYGILDQIAALEWVKKNIAQFGGDPDNVTIAGQSAGAFSVNALVVSPKAKGLFHKAIAQSGGMFNRGTGLVSGLKGAEERGKMLTDTLGITLADLRQLPADSLLKFPARFGTTIDGKVLPSVRESFENGSFSDVPLLTGWNADDRVSGNPPTTPAEFKANAKKQYGGRAGEYLELFPADSPEILAQTQNMMSGLFFGMQNYTWAKMQSEKGQNDAYVYYFTRVPPGEPNYGAFHSAEFSYALHTLRNWNRPFEQTDYDLEKTMSGYWLNFVKTGNPNGAGLPEWPVFDPANPMVNELGAEVKTRALPYWAQMKFMESLND
ncbi:carboxylesterase family protein [Algoriphagus sp. H41]|uniref:Carboxylic ester hydrolase n=1 Tax=Algoriphagus oliviformis TaxID=2811231 RepID=A0ABS3C1Y7_9BACT|nr:carboxylesterase family protein [Algoriphagus oliviformis]MBN7811133.1 carboxylesterase family protein [Algoriphagus oliviformis]